MEGVVSGTCLDPLGSMSLSVLLRESRRESEP